MARPPLEESKPGSPFKSVELFKSETLGTGSYGAVCKAKCDQLICAAKLLYPVLFQVHAHDPGKKHRLPSHRFESECQLLSRINHPNIVQYLGTHRDAETNAPVLLMELMDESLTHFLESSPGDIPYYIQVNLSQDIAQALAFLHANGIIHRDLSSNNVLILASTRAKVADFGMSKLINQTSSTTTMCPGTLSYMPPEALDEPPMNTEKLDNFSFGVLLVQIMTQLPPNPANKFRRISDIQSPGSNLQTQTGVISKIRRLQARIPIPEVERRQPHISLIEPTHPLVSISLCCLKDEHKLRPSSQELCRTLAKLKTESKYEASACQDLKKQLEAKNEQIREIAEILEGKEGRFQAQTSITDRLSKQLEEAKRQNKILKHENVVKEREIKKFGNQIESNEEIDAAQIQTNTRLKQILTSKSSYEPDYLETNPNHQAPMSNLQMLNIIWKAIPRVPIDMLAGSSAVISDKVFLRSNLNRDVIKFDSSNSRWQKLVPHPVNFFTLVSIENQLTTVGGWSERLKQCSNKLYCYRKMVWVEALPPMATRRCTPGAEYTGKILVVAGGRDGSYNALTSVEVLNTENSQWSTVSSLPFPVNQPSLVIYRNCIYLSNRYGASGKEKDSIVRTSIAELTLSDLTVKWERITSLPVSYSSLVTVIDHLLAVGGQDSEGLLTKNVYQYCLATDSWQVVSCLSVARYRCFATCLHGNTLVVVGGDDYNRCLEIGSTTLHLDTYCSAP